MNALEAKQFTEMKADVLWLKSAQMDVDQEIRMLAQAISDLTTVFERWKAVFEVNPPEPKKRGRPRKLDGH